MKSGKRMTVYERTGNLRERDSSVVWPEGIPTIISYSKQFDDLAKSCLDFHEWRKTDYQEGEDEKI